MQPNTLQVFGRRWLTIPSPGSYYCAAFIDSAVVDVKVQSGDCYMTIKNLISGSGTFSVSTSGKDNCETSTCDRAELGRGVEYGLDCVAL